MCKNKYFKLEDNRTCDYENFTDTSEEILPSLPQRSQCNPVTLTRNNLPSTECRLRLRSVYGGFEGCGRGMWLTFPFVAFDWSVVSALADDNIRRSDAKEY